MGDPKFASKTSIFHLQLVLVVVAFGQREQIGFFQKFVNLQRSNLSSLVFLS